MAQQSSCFIFTELTSVYIVPWLCIWRDWYTTTNSDMQDEEETRGRDGWEILMSSQDETRCQIWKVQQNKQCRKWLSLCPAEPQGSEYFLILKHVTQWICSKVFVAIALKWLMWSINWRSVCSLVGLVKLSCLNWSKCKINNSCDRFLYCQS